MLAPPPGQPLPLPRPRPTTPPPPRAPSAGESGQGAPFPGGRGAQLAVQPRMGAERGAGCAASGPPPPGTLGRPKSQKPSRTGPGRSADFSGRACHPKLGPLRQLRHQSAPGARGAAGIIPGRSPTHLTCWSASPRRRGGPRRPGWAGCRVSQPAGTSRPGRDPTPALFFAPPGAALKLARATSNAPCPPGELVKTDCCAPPQTYLLIAGVWAGAAQLRFSQAPGGARGAWKTRRGCSEVLETSEVHWVSGSLPCLWPILLDHQPTLYLGDPPIWRCF